MNFLLAAGIVALVTLLFSYVRAGRFGATVLALGAGYLFALLWADKLAEYSAFQVSFLTTRDLAYAGLVVAPGVLALVFSRKQKSVLPRIVAALALAIFVVSLLLDIFPTTPVDHQVYSLLDQYREVIMSAVLGVGLVDMLFARLPKAPKRSKD